MGVSHLVNKKIEMDKREAMQMMTKTITTKDGRTYTGKLYRISYGVLYIEGGFVEKDGWSIR